MEKFYIVTAESELRKEYLEYREFEDFMRPICKGFMEAQGIETGEYYRTDETFAIVPTEQDLKNFSRMLSVGAIKHGLRKFKKNSKIGKAWLRLVVDKGIKFIYGPWVGMYFDNRSSRSRYRMFNIDDIVYCSFETDTYFSIPADFSTPKGFVEIKASEFWAVIEGCEERQEVKWGC